MLNRSPVKRLKKGRGKEEFKRLCARVMASTDGAGARTVMVVGCNVGEGASTVAVNLAQTFVQEAGSGVLLAEANFRRPTFSKFFRLKNPAGLADVIEKKKTLDEAVQEIKDDELKVLTAGEKVDRPGSLFTSDGMNDFLRDAKEKFKVIIFDAPPIIAFSDSQYIAPKMDMVLLVVKAEKTRWEVARQAVQKLEEVGANIGGTVLCGKKFYVPKLIYNMF